MSTNLLTGCERVANRALTGAENFSAGGCRRIFVSQ